MIYVTSDIHGHYSLLMQRLDEVGFDKDEDTLICVGDLVDRGNENIECLELLDEKWFVATRGNHDQWCIDGLTNTHSAYYHRMRNNGGEWWYHLDKETQDYWAYRIRNLPLYDVVCVDDKQVLFVHADVGNDGNCSDSFSNLHLWSRASADAQEGDDVVVRGYDVVVHGHTPIQAIGEYDYRVQCDFGNEWLVKGNRCFIDSGVFFSKKLNVILLENLMDGFSDG